MSLSALSLSSPPRESSRAMPLDRASGLQSRRLSLERTKMRGPLTWRAASAIARTPSRTSGGAFCRSSTTMTAPRSANSARRSSCTAGRSGDGSEARRRPSFRLPVRSRNAARGRRRPARVSHSCNASHSRWRRPLSSSRAPRAVEVLPMPDTPISVTTRTSPWSQPRSVSISFRRPKKGLGAGARSQSSTKPSCRPPGLIESARRGPRSDERTMSRSPHRTPRRPGASPILTVRGPSGSSTFTGRTSRAFLSSRASREPSQVGR